MKETFGQRLCRLRKERGLTQGDIAKRLGITIQAVSKWENDQAIPDIALLPDLADILDVSTDMLLGRMGNGEVRFIGKEEAKDIVARIRVLSADGDNVTINLPVAMLSLAKSFAGQEGKEGLSALDGIDLGKIQAMAEQGYLGDIVNVKSADGDIVHIYLCHVTDKDEVAEDYFKARSKKKEETVDSTKEKTGVKNPEECLAKAQERVQEIASLLGEEGQDEDSLEKELEETSARIAYLSKKIPEWEKLEAEKEDIDDRIEEVLSSLKEGEGETIKLAKELSALKKRRKEIESKEERLLEEGR